MKDDGGKEDVEEDLWIKDCLLIYSAFTSVSDFSFELIDPGLVFVVTDHIFIGFFKVLQDDLIRRTKELSSFCRSYF